ncbi:MAG: hypothetical protein ACYDHE_02365 [Candidatus Acidiferrales bacterium]
MGTDYVLKQSDEAIKIVEKDYPATKPTIIESAMQGQDHSGGDPERKDELRMFTALNTAYVDTGGSPSPVETGENRVWTNKRISDIKIT